MDSIIPLLIALAILEMLIVQFLDLALYRYGIPIWRREVSVPRPIEPVGTVFTLKDAVFRVASQDRCVFRRQRIVYGPATALMMGCSLKWTSDDRALASGRIPVFATLLGVMTLVDLVAAMTAADFMWTESRLAALVITAMIAIAIPANRRSADKMLADYEWHEQRLTTASSRRAEARPASR